jgi:hypothetical protein
MQGLVISLAIGLNNRGTLLSSPFTSNSNLRLNFGHSYRPLSQPSLVGEPAKYLGGCRILHVLRTGFFRNSEG